MRIRISNNLEIQGANPEFKKYLRDLLTTTNPKWVEAKKFGRWTGNIPENLTQYEDIGEAIVVPRGLLQHLLEDVGMEFSLTDERIAQVSDPWPEPKARLRDNGQEQAAIDLLGYPNGFLSAPAGSGKTVLGIEICRRLQQKALWLTDRKELKDQAIETAVDLFNIPKEKIGVLHGKKWEIGEFLTVGMIPSMQKRDLSDIVREFGTVVVDEAHHVPCSRFLAVVGQFYAKNIYGLTATAYRSDKLEAMMFNAIGPIQAKIEHKELFDEEELIKPFIQQRETNWCPDNPEQLQYNDFMEKMVYDEGRNLLIVNDIVNISREPNVVGIILVDRTKHAEILTEMLKERGIACEFVVGSVDVEGVTSSGKKKKKAIPKKVRDNIISDFKSGRIKWLASTYDLLAEGFNYKPLNHLVMGAPVKWKGTVVQVIGRVQRVCEGKDFALVLDYVDGRIGMFEKQAESRLNRVYRPMGMTVQRI